MNQNTLQPQQHVNEHLNEVTDRKVKTYGTRIRRLVTLDGEELRTLPRSSRSEDLIQEGILPGNKYGLDVYIEILGQVAQEKSPEDIVETLCKTYPSLARVHLSTQMVRKVIQVGGELCTLNLPTLFTQLGKQGRPYALELDGTVRNGAGDTLLVAVAVYKDEEQTETETVIPVSAAFVISENSTDIRKYLQILRKQLPILPYAVVTDFSPAFREVVPEVFPEAIHQGCHYHVLELVAEVLVDPVLTELRQVIRPLCTGLRHWAKKIRFKENGSTVHKNIEAVITYFLRASNQTGKKGKTLIRTLQLMEELKKALEDCREQVQTDKELTELVRHLSNCNWRAIKEAIRGLKQHLTAFEPVTKVLREKFESEEDARKALEELIQTQITTSEITGLSEVKKGMKKLQRYLSLLTPAMVDPRIPRTTSILEGLHSKVKKTLRKWGGLMNTPSTFDWTAITLSFLVCLESFTEVESFRYLFSLFPLQYWVNAVLTIRERMATKRRHRQFAFHLLSFSPPTVRVKLRQYLIRELYQGGD